MTTFVVKKESDTDTSSNSESSEKTVAEAKAAEAAAETPKKRLIKKKPLGMDAFVTTN